MHSATPPAPSTPSTPFPPAPSCARTLISRLLAEDSGPFALLLRRAPGRPEAEHVELLLGPVENVDRLADIPLPPAASRESPAPALDALALIPFRQIRERGFDVRDDGTPLTVLRPREVHELPLADVLEALPAHRVEVRDGAFDIGDEQYSEIVRRVIDEEIGRGEGANFVIRRTFRGEIPDFGRADALALFRRLLSGERGAYWTYVVHTGGRPGAESGTQPGTGRTLIGASPEVHVRMSGETVVMNPISGTYRYPSPGRPDPEGLLDFLHDAKEIEELTMVVDEELKMMCTVGDLGGQVLGPRLKEMAHLAHTEYELRGRSTMDVRDVLRETMFAATVTGSPVQNACRVIERHELDGRAYYSGALALIGRDPGGARTLDSPILIRTADITADGALRVPVGATLVRHSDPHSEVAETHAKAAGVLTALGVTGSSELSVPSAHARAPRTPDAPPLARDPRVRAALDARRAHLAPFWLRMHQPPQPPQSSQPPQQPTPLTHPQEPAPHALVIDAEDTFTAMLAHLLRSSGLRVTVRRHDEATLPADALRHPGPIVLGPGPGNPEDTADPRIRLLRGLTADLLREHRHGLLGVCLGHELIAAELGLSIVRKAVPQQGAQERIDYFGRPETVGFYNTFTARCDDPTAVELARHGIELSRDATTGDVHALRGPTFVGVQFHPESVLSLNGVHLVEEIFTPTRTRA